MICLIPTLFACSNSDSSDVDPDVCGFSYFESYQEKNGDKIYHKPHWGQATDNEIYYTLYEEWNNPLDSERETIQKAAALWNEMLGDVQLVYVEPKSISTAQIVFYLHSFSTSAFAQTDFERIDDHNHIQEVSIFFDMAKIDNSEIEEGNKAGIIAHEFGHALGLAHVSDENALMYGPSVLEPGVEALPLEDRDYIISDKDVNGAKIMLDVTTHENKYVLEGSQLKCTICNITKPHDACKWVIDYCTDSKHYYKCICGKTREEAHSYAMISDNHMQCSECQYIRHTNMQYLDYEDGTHSMVCPDCGQTTEPHTWDNAPTKLNDQQHIRTCSICSRVEVSNHERQIRKYDETSSLYSVAHSVTCAVCNTTWDEAHDLRYDQDAAEGKHAQVCDSCTYSEIAPHIWKYDSIMTQTHRIYCGCGISSVTTHDYHQADGTIAERCSCGATMPIGEHTITTTEKDGTTHLLTCSCGWTSTKIHQYETYEPYQENSLYHKYICKDCGHFILTEHQWANNIPTMVDSLYHEQVCTQCKKAVRTPHGEWGTPSFVDATQHKRHCGICDTDIYANHTFTTFEQADNTLYHRKCCSGCTYKELTPHRFVEDTATDTDSTYHTKTCNDCGDVLIPHTYSAWANYDTSQHVKYCTECMHPIKAGHSFSDWGYSTSTHHTRTCATCGRSETGSHSYSTWQNYDSSQHAKYCSACLHTIKGNHSFTSWSYSTSAHHTRACNGCGRTETGSHSYGSWENYDSSQHAKYCASCLHTIKENHAMSKWDDYSSTQHRRTCACGRTETVAHTFGAWEKYSATQHRRTCSGCGRIETVNHSYGSWSDYSATSHRRTCSNCGYAQTTNHSYSAWQNYSSSQHVRYCKTCNHAVKGSHSYGSWSYYSSTQHRKKCTTCPRTTTASHTYQYSGGYLRCTGCGHEKPYS